MTSSETKSTSDTERQAFDTLERSLAEQGVEAALGHLIEQLGREAKYHEMFDALLMAARHRLGLPVIHTTSLDDLDDPIRTQMENEYLDACRRVGEQLLADGRVREAWMYLRPAGGRQLVAAALENIEPDPESLDPLLEVAIHEGVAPRRGFQWITQHYGTCNAITMFESSAAAWQPRDRQEVAALLVRHLYAELLANLRADIARREGGEPAGDSIAGLIEGRDWLTADMNYHVDTSHLGAVVRFARLVEDRDTLRLADELCAYGRRLDPQYQYQGEEPFTDVYPSHACFFGALLGRDVDAALAFFAERARSLPPEQYGTGPAETYVALLARLGRNAAAIEAAAELLPPGTPTSGFAPGLLLLSRQAGDYARLLEVSREQGDLLGFAAGLVQAKLDADDGRLPHEGASA